MPCSAKTQPDRISCCARSSARRGDSSTGSSRSSTSCGFELAAAATRRRRKGRPRVGAAMAERDVAGLARRGRERDADEFGRAADRARWSRCRAPGCPPSMRGGDHGVERLERGDRRVVGVVDRGRQPFGDARVRQRAAAGEPEAASAAPRRGASAGTAGAVGGARLTGKSPFGVVRRCGCASRPGRRTPGRDRRRCGRARRPRRRASVSVVNSIALRKATSCFGSGLVQAELRRAASAPARRAPA